MPIPRLTTTHPINKTVKTHTVTITNKDPDYIALATLLLPIALFFAGLSFNRELERRKEKKRLKDVRKYFFSLIPLLTKATHAQVKAIRETAEKLKKFEDTHTVKVPEVAAFSISKLRKIPHADLYKAFITSKSGTIEENTLYFDRINGASDFIHSAKPYLDRLNHDILIGVQSFVSKWNEQLGRLLFLKNTIPIESALPLDSATHEVITALNTALNTNAEQLKTFGNPKVVYELIILPVYEQTKDNEVNATNYDIQQVLAELKSQYASLTLLQKTLVSRLEKLAKNLEIAIKDLEEPIAHFKKKISKYI